MEKLEEAKAEALCRVYEINVKRYKIALSVVDKLIYWNRRRYMRRLKYIEDVSALMATYCAQAIAHWNFDNRKNQLENRHRISGYCFSYIIYIEKIINVLVGFFKRFHQISQYGICLLIYILDVY